MANDNIDYDKLVEAQERRNQRNSRTKTAYSSESFMRTKYDKMNEDRLTDFQKTLDAEDDAYEKSCKRREKAHEKHIEKIKKDNASASNLQQLLDAENLKYRQQRDADYLKHYNAMESRKAEFATKRAKAIAAQENAINIAKDNEYKKASIRIKEELVQDTIRIKEQEIQKLHDKEIRGEQLTKKEKKKLASLEGEVDTEKQKQRNLNKINKDAITKNTDAGDLLSL